MEEYLPADALESLEAHRAVQAALNAAEEDHVRRGRPTKDTPARRARILSRLSAGDFLTVICREERLADPDFPAPRTVDEWAEGDATFLAAIARAREAGGLALIAKAQQIAATGFADYTDGMFGIQFNRASVARSKLQVDTLIAIAEKLAPRQLGKKLELSNNPEHPFGGHAKPLSDYTEAELMAAFEQARERRGE